MFSIYEYKGNEYTIREEVRIKMPDGTWELGLMYAPQGAQVSTDELYVRTNKDFHSKFTKVWRVWLI